MRSEGRAATLGPRDSRSLVAESSTLARLVRPLIAVVALASAAASTALADGEAFEIIVTPPIVEPGGEITIQGRALWTELDVTANLVDPDGAVRSLGGTRTAVDGSLYWVVSVPRDIPDGRYDVVVTNASVESVQAFVVVRSSVPVIPIIVGLGVLAALGLSRGRGRAGVGSPSRRKARSCPMRGH